jgi:hypothetical protein
MSRSAGFRPRRELQTLHVGSLPALSERSYSEPEHAAHRFMMHDLPTSGSPMDMILMRCTRSDFLPGFMGGRRRGASELPQAMASGSCSQRSARLLGLADRPQTR